MAKGYWIGRVDITDRDTYKRYVEGIYPILATYGGRFVVASGSGETVEGSARKRSIVIEFPTLEAAQACYGSSAYQDVMKLRLAASQADLVIVGGFEGAQPGDAAA